MKLNAQQASAFDKIQKSINEPIAFHNYKNGILTVRVKNNISSIEGMQVVSSVPFFGEFLLKVKI